MPAAAEPVERTRLPLATTVALGAVGASLSAYLATLRFQGATAQCFGGSGCQIVDSSKYSTVLGAPVAVPGLLVYLLITVAAIAAWRGGSYLRRRAALVMFGLAVAGAAYSAYLTLVALTELEALCPWCLASAATMFALLFLSGYSVLRLRL